MSSRLLVDIGGGLKLSVDPPQITVSQNEIEIDLIDNIKGNLKCDQYLGKYFPFQKSNIKA